MSNGGPEVRERHEQRLIAFVLRARRVRAHSLARDLAALHNLQHPQYKITGRTDSDMVTLRTEYPPEEQVESAAARIRPLLLEDDDTHFSKAIAALKYFARDGGAPDEIVDGLKAFSKTWMATASEKSARLTYEVRIKHGEAPEESMNDRRLAFAWIYGDVVHADAKRRDGAGVFGVEERFHGAVPLVAQIMVLTIDTLKMIERLHGTKVLPFLHDAFAEDVVVTRQVVEQAARVWVAGYGEGDVPPTFPAAAAAEPGEGWSRFGDQFGPAHANKSPES